MELTFEFLGYQFGLQFSMWADHIATATAWANNRDDMITSIDGNGDTVIHDRAAWKALQDKIRELSAGHRTYFADTGEELRS